MLCMTLHRRELITGKLRVGAEKLFEISNVAGFEISPDGQYRHLTQALATRDACIKTGGVAGQAIVARVKHAASQVLRGTLAAPTRTAFAVAKIVSRG